MLCFLNFNVYSFLIKALISQRDGFAFPVSTIFISPIHIYEFAQFLLDQFTFMDTPLMISLDWGGEGRKNEQSKVDWKLGLFPVNSTLLSLSPPQSKQTISIVCFVYIQYLLCIFILWSPMYKSTEPNPYPILEIYQVQSYLYHN